MRRRLILLLLGFFLLTLFGEEGLIRLIQLKKTARALEEANQLITQENQTLKAEVVQLNDPALLERLIREELGYLGEHEELLEIP